MQFVGAYLEGEPACPYGGALMEPAHVWTFPTKSLSG